MNIYSIVNLPEYLCVAVASLNRDATADAENHQMITGIDHLTLLVILGIDSGIAI